MTISSYGEYESPEHPQHEFAQAWCHRHEPCCRRAAKRRPSLIIFHERLSFLDGKIRGFAKIVENYEVIEIAKRTMEADEQLPSSSTRTAGSSTRREYPRIRSLTMID